MKDIEDAEDKRGGEERKREKKNETNKTIINVGI